MVKDHTFALFKFWTILYFKCCQVYHLPTITNQNLQRFCSIIPQIRRPTPAQSPCPHVPVLSLGVMGFLKTDTIDLPGRRVVFTLCEIRLTITQLWIVEEDVWYLYSRYASPAARAVVARRRGALDPPVVASQPSMAPASPTSPAPSSAPDGLFSHLLLYMVPVYSLANASTAASS